MTAGLDRHGGARVARALQAHGVTAVYTLCGGHIAWILAAAKAEGLRVVDVRDEANAVFAADAAARLTGRAGVAVVTAGPGITNTVTALKNAQMAHSPVLLIGGAAPTVQQGRGALQDIDQCRLVEPLVKKVFKLRRVVDVVPAIEEALALAQSGVPGPVFVEAAIDVLYPEADIRRLYGEAAGHGQALAERALRWYLRYHLDRMYAGAGAPFAVHPRPVQAPHAAEAALSRSLAALARARRPLAVIGSQAVVMAGEVERVAQAVERLGVPVYLSGMARGLLGRDHPLQLRHQRRQALREADCVLLAGVPCDFRLDFGRHVRRGATLIAANRSRQEASLNRRPQIAAIGDAGLFLQSLAQAAPPPPASWGEWIATLRSRDGEREAEIDRQAAAAGEHVNPLALFRALDREAGEQAIFVADGGDFVGTASYVLRPRGPLGWLDPGAFGTLGVGAGFAMGAAVSHPGREVWIVYGDGACGFSLVEFDTFVRHGLPVIAIVGNDAGWTQIAREQVKMLKDDVATVLARTDYHAVAAGFGAEGIVVRHGDEVVAALRRARELARQGRPVLLNVWLDRTDFREGSLSM